MEHSYSENFEKYRARYERSGCTKEQLRKLVKLGALTPDEYREITGEEFSYLI